MSTNAQVAVTPAGVRSRGWLAVAIILGILLIDQLVKIWVKTHMCIHESIEITPWFYLRFIENDGMAYGMSFIPKILLTLFRIVAVFVLGWYLMLQVKCRARWGYVVFLSMIVAGAAGNIIDCLFYGLIFSASTVIEPAQWVAWGEGYGELLQGKVVDMLDFPIWSTTLPDWFPFRGGQEYTFFSAIFNVADACITSGVIAVILFFRKELSSLSSDSRQVSEKPIEQSVSSESPESSEPSE